MFHLVVDGCGAQTDHFLQLGKPDDLVVHCSFSLFMLVEMRFQLEWENCHCSLQINQRRNAAENRGVDVGMDWAVIDFHF
jgi:hypothetical protein